MECIERELFDVDGNKIGSILSANVKLEKYEPIFSLNKDNVEKPNKVEIEKFLFNYASEKIYKTAPNLIYSINSKDIYSIVVFNDVNIIPLKQFEI